MGGMGAISEKYGFEFAYLFGGGFALAGLCIVLFSRRNLFLRRPEGSEIPSFCKILLALSKQKNLFAITTVSSAVLTIVILLIYVPSLFISSTKVLAIIAGCFIFLLCIMLTVTGKYNDWVSKFDPTGTDISPEQVNSTQMMVRMLPFVATQVPFWAVYNQM